MIRFKFFVLGMSFLSCASSLLAVQKPDGRRHLKGTISTVEEAKAAARKIVAEDCADFAIKSYGFTIGTQDGQSQYLGAFECMGASGDHGYIYNLIIYADGGYFSALVPQENL